MRKLILLTCFLAFIACKEEKKESENEEQAKIAYASFGEEITDENVISKEEMAKKFENLKSGDTVAVKFVSSINEVCKAKGCWMKLDLGDKKESMVRFKDYGFFVPLDADNKEVIVNGKAYVTETTVKELQHFAKDAGKTEEEIAKITEPKFTYAFEADGVLLKK
ncbi:DUF4920 domain-containing protein [Aureibaculum sp. 2210JD6-5]|uniref:DUF4920 domain-containing protein n=1 Tax=Aureibaculum sp. 2210JD6-5 TaxID=3103957 RepID=UPI002AAD757C|nr:DUF4920 domain-containing protein [Aureibaculum sp. 2210JD6-5]MDY7395790.1 DUF4920 domain-containing protein [Aureibaculum sp. 2210JD6-5]